MSWNFTNARSPVERKPVVIVWPPPSVPTFSSTSTDGSLPSLVRNGPVALIRTGLSRPGLPFSWTEASTLRSALLIEPLNALSSRPWTFSLSPPPPQEASASAAKSRTSRARRTRRRLAGRHRNSARFGTLDERMGYVTKTMLVAVALAAVAAGPAQAGQVIVVDGNRAERVFDPAVPSRAEVELPPAGQARAAAAGARARASTKRGRRAVYAALRRELRRKRISRAD